jgi:hypothetical protein
MNISTNKQLLNGHSFGVLSWLCQGRLHAFSRFKYLRGQINMSRATFDRELRVARARFTAFFILSRGLSVQNTAIRSLAFQREKLTVPYLAVISTNKSYTLSYTTHFRKDINDSHLHWICRPWTGDFLTDTWAWQEILILRYIYMLAGKFWCRNTDRRVGTSELLHNDRLFPEFSVTWHSFP